MADAAIFAHDVRMAADEGRSHLKSGALKKILVVCMAALAAEVVWLFVINPGIPFARVTVNEVEGVDRAALLKAAGVTAHSSYLTFNVKAAEAGLRALPVIATATVVKHFPDSLSIEVTARTPAAVSLAEINGRPELLCFDKQGVIYEIGGSEWAKTATPIISGLAFDHVTVGAKLPASLLPLLADITRLRENAPELLEAISEIRINKTPYDTFDILLYTQTSGAKIRIGQSLNEDTLRYVLLLSDVLAGKELDVDTIDFRTGTASYILKNEVEGKDGE